MKILKATVILISILLFFCNKVYSNDLIEKDIDYYTSLNFSYNNFESQIYGDLKLLGLSGRLISLDFPMFLELSFLYPIDNNDKMELGLCYSLSSGLDFTVANNFIFDNLKIGMFGGCAINSLQIKLAEANEKENEFALSTFVGMEFAYYKIYMNFKIEPLMTTNNHGFTMSSINIGYNIR